jgi:hypothetical protein
VKILEAENKKLAMVCVSCDRDVVAGDKKDCAKGIAKRSG